jgi:CHAD domain-containing protein
VEIEAKFALPDLQTLRRLASAERLAGLDLGPGTVKQVHDTYLDTTSRHLLTAGYACRRREQDDGLLYTLKQLTGLQGPVHRREELEILLTSDQLPAQWPECPARDRLLEIIGQELLLPLFELSQRRIVRLVQRDNAVVAELSLDQVELIAAVERQRFLELEVELLGEGSEQDLAPIVVCLQDEWHLQPEPRSKFERGLRLLGKQSDPGKLLSLEERSMLKQIAARDDKYSRRAIALLALDEGDRQREAGKRAHLSARRVRYWLAQFRGQGLDVFPLPVRDEAASAAPVTDESHLRAQPSEEMAGYGEPAEPATVTRTELPKKPGLDADDSMAEAAGKIFRFHLQRMLYHEPGTRKGQDIEELHDMRVATRRMRAAMRVFGDYLEPGQMAPFTKGLRRTGRVLGAVRDLDVFRDKAQNYLDTLPATKQDRLDPLLAAWRTEREAARKKMIAYLDGERYARFKVEFTTFLEKPNAGGLPIVTEDGEPIPHRLRHVVPVVVYQRLAAVRAFDEWVTQPDVPLERLHQLRIAGKRLRYALEFFHEVLGPESEALIDMMKEFQDHLGDLQDAVVACNLLRDFLTWGTWGHARSQEGSWPSEPVVAPGVATYMAVRQKEIQHLVETFPQAWSKIQASNFCLLLESALSVLW